MKITNYKIYGLTESVIASGYPMRTDLPEQVSKHESDPYNWANDRIDSKSHKRATHLGNMAAGSGHDCFMKGIIVQFDLTAPLYLWKQFQRYHFHDIVSSQSTMHMILEMDIERQCNEHVFPDVKLNLKSAIQDYKEWKAMPEVDRKKISEVGMEYEQELKRRYMCIISNIPSGFELTARITSNYLQLKSIFYQRKNHKLEEWRELCSWIAALPRFAEFCLAKEF